MSGRDLQMGMAEREGEEERGVNSIRGSPCGKWGAVMAREVTLI